MFNKRKVFRLVMMAGLLLGIHNGYLALWQAGDQTPCTIYPMRASLLPQAEQEQLEKGIIIRDEAHLKNLLRDYLS